MPLHNIVPRETRSCGKILSFELLGHFTLTWTDVFTFSSGADEELEYLKTSFPLLLFFLDSIKMTFLGLQIGGLQRLAAKSFSEWEKSVVLFNGVEVEAGAGRAGRARNLLTFSPDAVSSLLSLGLSFVLPGWILDIKFVIRVSFRILEIVFQILCLFEKPQTLLTNIFPRRQ